VFGFRVVFYDPFVEDGRDKAIGVERVESLSELMAMSDCVSVHCNCTAENTKMINKEALASAKRGAFFVNTARGELVDDEVCVCVCVCVCVLVWGCVCVCGGVGWGRWYIILLLVLTLTLVLTVATGAPRGS
jgi:hypothetical protein